MLSGFHLISFWLYATFRVTNDAGQRLFIVKENGSLHLVTLSHTWEIECRMASYLEMHLLLAQILHRPNHVYRVVA